MRFRSSIWWFLMTMRIRMRDCRCVRVRFWHNSRMWFLICATDRQLMRESHPAYPAYLPLTCFCYSGSVPTFHPEYGRYMLESTPGSPYNGTVTDLLSVERNMRYRRKLARAHLRPNEVPMTLTSFPRLGVREVFTDPPTSADGAVSSHSLFLPEEITNPHARFP